MTDDLIRWLRVVLDDVERDAPEVHAASCPAVDSSGALYAVTLDSCTCGWPKRLLAEVDAKRRLLDWIDRTVDRDQAYRILALPYVDRPGYRSEWAP